MNMSSVLVAATLIAGIGLLIQYRKLQASERNLRSILESIPGMIACANPLGEQDYTNQRLLDFIVAYDLKFYEQLPKLFAQNPGMVKLFRDSPEVVETTAQQNSSLQGAYLIMAASALGLDCGPLSGFHHAKVDEEFFAAGKPCFGCDQEFFSEGHVKSNFLCNLGYGDPGTLYPRLPRLTFTEACSLL